MALESLEIGLYVVIISLLITILFKLFRPQDPPEVDLEPILKKTEAFMGLSSNITGSHTQVEASHTQVQTTYSEMAGEYKQMRVILGALNTTLEGARGDNRRIQQFGRDLSDVLKKPSIRGSVAEKLLEDMCRQYLPDHQWEHQAVTDSEASSQQGGVDVLIHYNEVDLPVDSKFPREAWKRYVNLAEMAMADLNEAQIDTHNKAIKSEFKEFQKSVLAKVKEIQGHINPPDTTDFAMMFIPTEAMYYSVISDKNAINDQNIVKRQGKPDAHLLDVMLERKVIPVSPSIFYAYLEVINIGLSNLAILNNLEGLRKKVDDFKIKRGTYTTAHEQVGKMLKDALAEWETEDKRFKELGKKADDVIGALDNVEIGDAPTEED